MILFFLFITAHPIRKKSKHLSDLSDNSEDSELHGGPQQLHHHLSISQIFGNSTGFQNNYFLLTLF